MACLREIIQRERDHIMAHYSLAYTILDLLFTARTERGLLTPKHRAELIQQAHTHFERTRELAPDSVVFFYREGVLFKEIEGKPRQAIPLFEQAITNWEKQSAEEQKQHHQQRPKYIKSLYHLASCLLKIDLPRRGLQHLDRMMALDQDLNHMHPLFKHFAMGKVLFALGRPKEALDHLETAAHRADRGQATDFVWELAARCALDLGLHERAAACIGRIPPPARRPYVRWTEADVLVARGQEEEAIRILTQTAERDRRGRHKALLRLARECPDQRGLRLYCIILHCNPKIRMDKCPDQRGLFGPRDQEVPYKGETILMETLKGWHCPAYGESEFATSKETERFENVVSAAMQAIDGRIAAEIRTIRKRLGLKQAKTAAIFCEGKCLYRVRAGHSQPGKATILLLKLLDHHPELLGEIKPR